jgi:hypothetical protein
MGMKIKIKIKIIFLFFIFQKWTRECKPERK